MRTFVLCAALISCSDPDVQLPPAAPTAAIANFAVSPSREDGLIAASVRFALEVTVPLVDGRIEVIAGGADANDLSSLAKNRPTVALRAREIATTMWSEGSTIVAQPTRALPAGRNTLVVLQERRAPLAIELTVAAKPSLPQRVWTTDKSVTYCGGAAPEAVVLQPGAVQARVVRRGACFEVSADRSLASLVLPATVDPAPIGLPEAPPLRPEPPCPESAYVLGSVCVRVDDDRIVLLGGTETRRLLVGRIGTLAIGEVLPIGERRVLRGFPPLTPIVIDLLIRDPLGDRSVRQTLTTRRARRHAVINEVLARPPSGAPTQKFLEIANDGEGPMDLSGLVLRDGDDTWELPDAIVPAGSFALITPELYVDGLAGEPAPPKGVDRILVDALRLTGPVSLEEADGTVLSRFPATTSTRIAARVRRTPDAPDDSPDAFTFATPTPGRANVIPP